MVALVLAGAAVGRVDAATPATEWRYTVRLDGQPIGTHQFVLARSADDGVTLTSEARFDVTLLGVPVYRYRHRVSERWTDGCLASIDARTDDGGRLTTVRGEWHDGRFDLQVVEDGGAKPRAVATTGCLMSFAYWNPALARQQRLLDAGSGRVESIAVTAPPAVPADLGAPEGAVRGLRVGGLVHPIDVWYVDDRWVGLDTVTGNGRRLSYRLR
jgi:hypothetical protein